MDEEESEEAYCGLDGLTALFEEKKDVAPQNSMIIGYSLRSLLSEPFSWYFIPNNILTKEPIKERAFTTLYKFKESNTGKVMEDMMYYCAPVEILEKIDAQNSGNITYESEREFMEDLGIVSFFQNENIISQHMKDEDKVSQITNLNTLKNWKDYLGDDKQNNQENIDKINLILLLVQKAMKKLTNKKIDKNEILENLNEIISEIKKSEVKIENIGFKMQIVLENNLLFLFGLINKYFGKDEEMYKFLEKYLQLFTTMKSNRLFFAIIEYLSKNRNIIQKINLEYNFEIFSEKCIDISEIINSIKNEPSIEDNIFLPNLSNESTQEIDNEKEKGISYMEDDFWALNNSEQIFIFKLSKIKPKIKLYFYRIYLGMDMEEIKNEDDKIEKDGNHCLLDFGEINLSNDENDEILEINISIKNDIIYVCYFINKQLKNSEDQSKKSEFYFSCKLFTTSMILLKEEFIKFDNFKINKSLLCSDKDNLYVISEENKVFVMKKGYSMNSFELNDLSINFGNKNMSLNDYKYYNNLNIDYLLILENKNDINDLLLVQTNRENNKYIFNIIPIKQNIEKKDFRYKISYNDHIFIFTKFNKNKISFAYTEAESDNFSEKGFQFLPFDTTSIKNKSKENKKLDIYKKLIKDYAYYVNLYGNFDMYIFNKIILSNFPYSLCFNINSNNFNFLVEQILQSEDMEINYYYIAIVKQYICCLYNTNLFDIKMLTNLFEYFKNFIINIKKNKDNKYRNKILKEIIYISSYLNDSNLVEISDLEKIILVKDTEKDLKINLLLLDLLLTQPKTQQNPDLFKLLCEFDKIFLSDIFNDKIDSLKENKIITSLFKLYKKVMSKAICIMNNYYLNNDNQLFKYMKKISENVLYISNLYKIIYSTNIGRMPFLFNSVNFLFFFLIIQRRIMADNFNKDFEIFSSLYNTLIALDELDINKYSKKALDLDNFIEITNSKVESDIKLASKKDEKEDNHFNKINFYKKQNITFRSNFVNYVGAINLNSYFEKIILITKENNEEKMNEIDINHCIDEIFYDVHGIIIYFEEKIDFKWRAILDIIPIKDVKEYLEIKRNENFKIINSIQKTLLNYFLSLMNKIDNKINLFLKKDKVKNFCKLYHNEFLQFIYTNEIDIDMSLFSTKKDLKSENNDKKEEEKKNVENIISMIDNFKADLIYSLGLFNKEKDKDIKDANNSNLILEILDKFISFFGDFNKKKEKNTINFESYYNKRDITLNQIKSYKEINLKDKSYEKIFEQFEKDIAKKNRLLSTMKSNESLTKIILKIFQIIIKYYNYNSKFFDLIKTGKFTNQNEDYNLFLDIYEKCCQMKMVYNQEKSRFVDEKFEEESQNYFKVTFAKLDFLYKIIIPSFNENLKYDKSIVQNMIELIKDESFNPKEILKYSEIQNIICAFKGIELLIINNLLLNLNDEENIKLILHIINDIYNKNKENNKYSINISLLDSVYGADYSQMQQVKNYFHLLIGIILEKFIYNKDKYESLGVSTKILLYQSLLWKYKGRDFNIIPKILNVFEDLKKGEYDKNKIVFDLGHEKVFRINNYNAERINDIKFEIFKIISSQIFLKLKENLEINNTLNEINTGLILTRNLSNINNSDNILNLLMSYFISIENNNKYYHDLILFFYKNLLNSPKLISILNTSKFYDVIVKILKIIFDEEKSKIDNQVNNNKNKYTKFIILKLFLQILQNIDTEEKVFNLMECCLDYDKNAFQKNEDENPFIYLVTKFNSKLDSEENSFIKHYYIKIFLFCLNKIEKSELIPKENKLLNINFLLSLDENLSQIEQKFYVKSNVGEEFEEIALFSNNEIVKIGKTGNLLCYMEDNNTFNEFIINSDITYFDYNDFIYNVQQIKNCLNLIVIMDEILSEKIISKINNLDIKILNDIIIIPNKNNNIFCNTYFEKNSKYIYDSLISKLFENQLNYKGINYILKAIYNFLDYITNENADKLIKYIVNYITDKKVETNQKEWDFCSYEYIDNEMNSYKNIFYSLDFDINKEKKKEKEEKEINIGKDNSYEAPLLLSSLFNYSLNNHKDFYIEYKSNSNINETFQNELTLINTNLYNDKEKEKYEIKMTNLSFYKSDEINDSTLITNDSLLLTSNLSQDQELLNILSENSGKIKSIIVSKVEDSLKEENNNFLAKIQVPIYLVTLNYYTVLRKFFIEGIGGTYLTTNKKIAQSDSDIIPIYYPDFLLKNKSENDNNNKDEIAQKKNNKYSDFYTEGDFCLQRLFSYDDNEQINKDEKQQILLQYKEDIIKKFDEINFDINKVFCLENIKLCYRILYELFKKENIINKTNKEILDKNIDIIMNIFDSLCKEYYFNIKQNLPIHKLQNLLKDFLKSLGKLDNFGKTWSRCLINYTFQSMNKSNEKEEKENIKSENVEEKKELIVEINKNDDDSDEEPIKLKHKYVDKITKKKGEILMLEKCKDYDLLLFIFKNCNELIIDKNSINIYYEIINNILDNSIAEKKPSLNKNKIKTTKIIDQEFIAFFLYEWMNEIYNIIINNKPNSKQLVIDYFINNDKFHNLMLKFIDEVIEIKNYFVKEGKNKNQTIPKSKTLLIQFGFKYLDICFYIFFKEKQYSLIKYWFKSNNDFFYFYSSYKMLATDKHYEEVDYKELLSIIAYISDSISCFKGGNKDKNNKYLLGNETIQIKANEFNKVKLNFKNDYKTSINITSFSFNGLDNSKEMNIKYNKLAIFSYNRNEDTYNLLDIIDTSDHSSIKLSQHYLQTFNSEDIYLVPLENLSTSLYAFGSNFNHSLGINGKLAKYYDKPSKCIGLPDNIWNIGYGNNYCLALCDDNKMIYACGCNKGGGFNSTPRATFTDDTKINKNKDSDNTNKFINFATGNCDSTLLLNENGELFGIGNNEEKIFGFEEETKIKYPKKLNMKIWSNKKEEEKDEEKKNDINEIKEEEKIGKIKSFYIGYKNSYLINEEGKLFGLGNNEYYQISSDDNKISYELWKNIPLPENCSKFIDVAVGECYIICLIEDKEGNNKLYARGKNDYHQCGISEKEKNVRFLTMCDNVKNLNFRKIYSRNKESAAITIDGDLYVLNDANQQFTLVLFSEKNLIENNNNKNEINEIKIENNNINDKKIIVDDVAISLSHMLIIARQFDEEKGVYIRKLFGFGSNSKGALGIPINSNKDENTIASITEIPLLDENDKKLVPIKLTIGDSKSYVLCLNEEELIQNIKNNKDKEKTKYSINISNISIEREEKNILDFYYSKNVELFINLFRSITSKALSNFIESIDEIKMDNQDLMDKENKDIILSVNFPSFYDYILKHQKLTELAHIFIQSNISEKDIKLNLGAKPELESIFNYLKSKAKYISSDIFKYCETNEKSESKQFLQKAIGNNLLYLNAQIRLDKFNELFSKLRRKYGSDRRIEVDRFKSNIFYDKFNENPKNKIPDLELNQTIFGQVFHKFGHMKGEDFLIKKNDRLFVVNLQNEYASDSGGPYHEVISQMCQELQSEYLNMFIKTPNNKHDIGLLRDKYIPNPDAKRKIYEEAYEFLGKLMASAIATGEALDLNLHPVVWTALLGNEITFYDYENIDYTFFGLINNLEMELKPENEEKDKNSEGNISNIETNNKVLLKEEDENFQEKYNLNFIIKNSNETDIELKPDGEKIPVNLSNLKEYISLSKKIRTSEFMSQIEFIKKGFNSVIPSNILQHLYWRQLEELVCGKATLDIRLFKENTRYEGFEKDNEVIKWFWDWLGKCSEHEQSLYLKFVSGRTRLPKDKNFKYTHVIQKYNSCGSDSFPNSATCFFTLKLPVYKDRETLEKKMNYSILNCDEIDGDN